jgi:hypothetical protein
LPPNRAAHGASLPTRQVSDRRGTAVRLAVLATALVALLAVVALSSRAGVPWSGTSGDSEGRSLALVGRLAVDALLVAFAVALLGVFVLRMRRPQLGLARGADDEEEDEEEAARSPWGRLAVRVAPYVLLALIVLLTLLFAREVDRRFPRGEPPRDGGAEGGGPPSNPSLAPPPDAAGWVLAAAGGLVLLALTAATAVPAARRRLAEGRVDEVMESERYARVLDESIDDLRAEPDPRRAVIAAYARMERGLAGRGHGRHAFETPLEYLARVLSEVGADPKGVGRLTALFERAKFSQHPVGQDDKDEAIDCLVAIRNGLS